MVVTLINTLDVGKVLAVEVICCSMHAFLNCNTLSKIMNEYQLGLKQ